MVPYPILEASTMNRCARRVLVVAAFLSLAPGMARADATLNARFMFHLTAPVLKNQCALKSSPPACTSIVTRGQVGVGYFAYVVISNTDLVTGLAMAKFGIDYNGASGVGIDIVSWGNCSTVDFPSPGWPDAGTGNLVTWDNANCHHVSVAGTVMAIPGYFYLSAYSPDEIEITPRPLDNSLEVANCGGGTVPLSADVQRLGWARFSASGAIEGHAPCDFRNSPCRVRGPEYVAAGEPGINFTVDPEYVSSEGHWIIDGNGQISSSDNDSAVVTALGSGSFTISYRQGTGCVEGCQCDYPVTVLGPVPVQPSTWSQVKAILAGED